MLKMKKRMSSTKLYIISTIFVFVGGIGLSFYTALNNLNAQRTYLKQRTAGLANAVSLDVVDSLSATESDIDTANYDTLKATLQSIVRVNPDIRFVYITKIRDDNVYFVADSEQAGSDDESPPGQLYDEVDMEYESVHITGVTTVVGPVKDRWGTWVSGAAPILKDNKIIAVFGMDIPAGSYTRGVVNSGVQVMLPTLLVVILLLVGASRSRLKDAELTEHIRLLTLVTDGIRTPLEGVKQAMKQLSDKVSADPEASKLTSELSESVSRVVVSIGDIMGASGTTTGKKTIELVDRVDVVAVVIDAIDAVHLIASTRGIAVRMGDSWPASFVCDTNDQQFSRLINSVLSKAINISPTDAQVDMRFIKDQQIWVIELSHMGVSPETNTDTMAVLSVMAVQLGAKLIVAKGIINLEFSLNGKEIQR